MTTTPMAILAAAALAAGLGSAAPATAAPSHPAVTLADYACGPGYHLGGNGRCYPGPRPSYFAPPRPYYYDRPRYYERPRYDYVRPRYHSYDDEGDY